MTAAAYMAMRRRHPPEPGGPWEGVIALAMALVILAVAALA